jgi:hypothetical protein
MEKDRPAVLCQRKLICPVYCLYILFTVCIKDPSKLSPFDFRHVLDDLGDL